MRATCTAFAGSRRIASGPLDEVALAVKAALDANENHPLLVFDDISGKLMDFDLRGAPADIVARLATESPPEQPQEPSRGPGRPKLGVVAREVTLLPGHWDWLNAQPGGASVALRKLVETARVTHAGADRRRVAQQSADRFMAALAGNERGYEEAARALYAGDRIRFAEATAPWPADVRRYAMQLSTAAFDEGAA
ncbi:MAG TPA: DUF2239 family protein [Xanthobacteraceae bacterium]|jgi:hypothetical protein